MSENKRLTREAMRARRRTLSASRQRCAAEALAARVGAQLFFKRARHIAFYLDNDGEISPLPLLRLAVEAGKTTYLPVLNSLGGNVMTFLPWRPGEPLKRNHYGIPEPRKRNLRRHPHWLLDLVFMPLVAFDGNGNRLGMGGGYYDRTFADRTLAGPSLTGQRKPLLVGLAHGFQQVKTLPAERWDVPLDAVATDRGIISVSAR